MGYLYFRETLGFIAVMVLLAALISGKLEFPDDVQTAVQSETITLWSWSDEAVSAVPAAYAVNDYTFNYQDTNRGYFLVTVHNPINGEMLNSGWTLWLPSLSEAGSAHITSADVAYTSMVPSDQLAGIPFPKVVPLTEYEASLDFKGSAFFFFEGNTYHAFDAGFTVFVIVDGKGGLWVVPVENSTGDINGGSITFSPGWVEAWRTN